MNFKDIKLYQPAKNSHKGQNGKLLVIGGSELFHSSIFWSADVASKIIDLVHLTSPANENNQIFRKKLKEKFWNGIVADWNNVEEYIKEDDCVLIGPGMVRAEQHDPSTVFSRVASRRISLSGHPIQPFSVNSHLKVTDVQFPRKKINGSLAKWGKEDETGSIVNYLLKKYPTKKWVIDGGALQEVDVKLITKSCILTPHRKEFGIIDKQINRQIDNPIVRFSGNQIVRLSKQLNGCTILLKGPVDTVCQGNRCVEIAGGGSGMTKGGTGDVLAGLAAALYTKNDSWTAAVMASHINKKAGESLCQRVGPYFNAEDLVKEVPLTIYGIMREKINNF